MSETPVTTVRLPTDFRRALEALALANGQTRSSFIRNALVFEALRTAEKESPGANR